MTVKLSDSVRSDNATDLINRLDQGTSAGLLRVFTAPAPTRASGWVANKTWAVDTIVFTGSECYRCTTAGAGGATEPTWPGSGTVADGAAVWTYEGAPTVLGTLTLSDPCGTQDSGTVTFSVITQDSAADASGQAVWALGMDSDQIPHILVDVGVSGSGAALQLNTVNIVAGGPIDVSSAVVAMGGL